MEFLKASFKPPVVSDKEICSPLFCLLSRTLSDSYYQKERESLLVGFKIGLENIHFSHLQFANDNLIFSRR